MSRWMMGWSEYMCRYVTACATSMAMSSRVPKSRNRPLHPAWLVGFLRGERWSWKQSSSNGRWSLTVEVLPEGAVRDVLDDDDALLAALHVAVEANKALVLDARHDLDLAAELHVHVRVLHPLRPSIHPGI